MKEVNLKNKKILYIGPVFFQYDKEVINKLIELGAIVAPFELYPDSIYLRTIKKLKKNNLVENYLDDYYNQVLNTKNYDYILIRHGFQLKVQFLIDLRKANPAARIINFHWDSIKPKYDYIHLIKYFDKVFSFDYKDCEKYDVSYLPLFYIDDYAKFAQSKNSKREEIDILFIGAWRNQERYNLIKETVRISKENGLTFYHYLFSSYKNQFDSLKKGVLAKGARSKSLTHQDILNYFSKSSNIIDFPSSFQTGLTIRTFETLGAGKKLITTNKNILKEPFYNAEYIHVIDLNNYKLDINFIKHKPSTSILEVMQNYSIRSYIYKLLQG